jgi:2-polyprenyl-3-methyl-5-hydroxy-6-metoxy-1,4-benzoquinol methylase
MIEIARHKAATREVENVRFDHATLFDEALEKGSFDVVMGFNFLHLLEDIPGAVRRINELLKPGGLFISKTVCLAEQSRLWSVLLAVMKALGLAPYVKCLKVAELEDIITSTDFEIIETGFHPPSPPSRYIVARKSSAPSASLVTNPCAPRRRARVPPMLRRPVQPPGRYQIGDV